MRKYKPQLEKTGMGLKKNLRIHVLLDQELMDKVKKGVEALNKTGLECTITSFARLAMRNFANLSIDSQVGLAFRPPKKKEVQPVPDDENDEEYD